MNVTCNVCKSWDKQSEKHGKCRVESPQSALVPMQGIGGQQLSVVSYWPETKPDDWCEKGVKTIAVQS